MNLPPPRYYFCPLCGHSLRDIADAGRIRQACAVCPWIFYPRVAIGVTGVLRHERRVVLVKRRFEPFAGSWMFPSGFVEYGEHPSEAVVREFREETGLDVTVVGLIDILQSTDDPRELGHLSFAYSLTGKTGMLRNDPDENDDVNWFSVDDPPQICFEIHRDLINACYMKQK